MYTNVNVGLCHWRVTNNKPAFFVNYSKDGENCYEYFILRSSAENRKNYLLNNPKN
jgi:hypothetical protein